MMFYRKSVSFVAVLALALMASVAAFATESKDKRAGRVYEPLNLAILIQDDLTSQVSNELGVTRDFIRSLPTGSQVMVAYITSGSLQVRQPFTADLEQASRALRMPVSSTSVSPYNPYVEVIQALLKFEATSRNKNAVLLISDGLDTSHGFDSTSAGTTLALERAIQHANDRNVSVYAFYAPSVGLTSHSRLAASYGQSSLNRLARDTGGKAFFQGTSGFVSFDSHFRRLKETLNEQSTRVS
ncbi:MAG TPA: hypothetical protein VEW46_22570 [Pyrinomonadaceae bacterium]|nr:hypothetical protein [Pyrinomonadaceae bacterium]